MHPLRLRNAFIIITTLLLLYYFLPAHLLPFKRHHGPPALLYHSVDWSRYAYSQYATNSAYLCNSIMVFEALHRLGSKADRLLMYPQEWDLEIASSTDRDSQLLVMARDKYRVKLMPVDVRSVKEARTQEEKKKKKDEDTWDNSITKFLAFNQTSYDRVLHFDSDVTVLQHMDELFLLPSAPVAMLRAYWSLPAIKSLTSLFVLIEPSEEECERLFEYAGRAEQAEQKGGQYDMEILNHFYADSAMVLPHRGLGLLTGEFRSSNHANYLGDVEEEWDPDRALEEASLVHFSDWPIPKPWINWPGTLVTEMVPKCGGRREKVGGGQEEDCRNKEIWVGLYKDFRDRRKDICRILPVPAPEWPPQNARETGTAGQR